MTLKHIPDRAVWPWRANAVQSGKYNFFCWMLPCQATNSHAQLSPPPFLFLLLRLLSNIQEGIYWNNNSILSLSYFGMVSGKEQVAVEAKHSW